MDLTLLFEELERRNPHTLIDIDHRSDDTAIKEILSPFATDRSALADTTKLAESPIAPRRAILIYGFEDSRRPLDTIIDAFEVLARARVSLGPRGTGAADHSRRRPHGRPRRIDPVTGAATIGRM